MKITKRYDFDTGQQEFVLASGLPASFNGILSVTPFDNATAQTAYASVFRITDGVITNKQPYEGYQSELELVDGELKLETYNDCSVVGWLEYDEDEELETT